MKRGTEGGNMLRDDVDQVEGAEDSGAGDGSPAERRRAFRRRLPFGRGAVLSVAGRAHIVGLADASVTGAYLTARVPVAAGETHLLKLLLLPARREVALEVALKVEVVRVSLADPESPDPPRGVAVRFLDLDERSRDLLQAFVAHEPRRPA
ncbi:MAG TPA: PilZ domain-containing protein [Vicinamibacteria bacterium]|nr:PilZ domain-containing protein [Vicinamibacteria bacterium]